MFKSINDTEVTQSKRKYTINRSLAVEIIIVYCVIRYMLLFYNLMTSVPITTNVASSNPADGEVYWIQHYLIQFVSDLRQVGGFHQVLRFPPPIKLISTI
jgi:hypothetical protein